MYVHTYERMYICMSHFIMCSEVCYSWTFFCSFLFTCSGIIAERTPLRYFLVVGMLGELCTVSRLIRMYCIHTVCMYVCTYVCVVWAHSNSVLLFLFVRTYICVCVCACLQVDAHT